MQNAGSWSASGDAFCGNEGGCRCTSARHADGIWEDEIGGRDRAELPSRGDHGGAGRSRGRAQPAGRMQAARSARHDVMMTRRATARPGGMVSVQPEALAGRSRTG